MSTLIDFLQHDKHENDSRILADGSISIQGTNLDPEHQARLWLAKNLARAPDAEGLKATDLLHQSPHCVGYTFGIDHPRAKETSRG